ncbi:MULTISPECIES: RNA polymerase sigma factor [unclassified Clostridium]|uniref:RNA polymerase sigma factor n=1 Tax=unclassified Clostridium TaxID=2614128 RepID=UPI0002981972|nr:MULTISPECIES: RNA polymerase sigma factor [unclassified Clostridium]EKQ51252.1 MAG: RNA polymerase sigma factor, sigma-70 family [Clostridium sp. Maddingley MBC34-26]
MDVDKKLIIKCKKYDKNSFMELFQLYEKYLYCLCYNYTQNQQDALDLVQETYIKVFNNISNFDESLPFHPWIRKITVNTCLNFKRAIKNNLVSLNQSLDEDITLEDILVSEDDVEDKIINLEIKRIIKDNLKEIPDKYRIIIVLRYYEDLNYNEIAKILDKPLGTVKTELYRAKAILKNKLKEAMEVRK